MTDQTVPRPSPLGLRASFGFGDRLGSAGPGHLAACRQADLAPILAQQSIRELARTGREPDQVMAAARAAVVSERWTAAWGADADHLKTTADVARLAAAGFTFFTIDPSEHVDDRADSLTGDALRAAAEAAATAAFESLAEAEACYLGRREEVEGVGAVTFEREPLYRALVKYGRAVGHAATMAAAIRAAQPPQGAEIELSVDETATPTSTLEHLFIALELRRRGVQVVSLAPRFVGDFEKGIDYRGDLDAFTTCLTAHAAVARQYGPYKISVHSGSDKFSIYPIVGRVCGELLHVKTAGTSYLEALRVVVREQPDLFRDIAAFALGRYASDKATYHVSARPERLGDPARLSPAELEGQFLNGDDGRQVLHVTFGSVLAGGCRPSGEPFQPAVAAVLADHPEHHRQVLEQHLGRHVTLLRAG